MRLKNKTVVVTGASQGLGAVTAKKIADKGAHVILLARREEFLKNIQSDIQDDGGEASYYVCDIRDLDRVEKVAQQIIKESGSIDILINNAGVWTDDELEKEKPSLRKEAFDTNVLGHINVIEQFLPHLKERKEAIIFNVISSAAVSDISSGDNTNWKSYGASKWGMKGYTHALRKSLRGTTIKVMQYFPGGFESNLYENANRENPHNQHWMMKTEDVADIILFALTRPSDVYMEKIVVSKKI